MIKKYNNYADTNTMFEDDNGEFYKVEDIETLLKTQFKTLNIKEGDILIIYPLENTKWKPEQAEEYFEIIREIFKKEYDNIMVAFTGDSKIEVKNNLSKSNLMHLEE